jgi:hypothetical protein
MRRLIFLLVMLLVLTVITTSTSSTFSAFSGTTANPSSSFSAAASFCRSYTVLRMSGLEHGAISTAGSGLFNSVSTLGGTVTADSAVVRSGNYALKIADTTSTDTANARWNVSSAEISVRFGLRMESLPGADVNALVTINASAGTNFQFGYQAATQKLEAGFGSSKQTAATTISAGQWYLIDLKVDTTANPNTADWRIDGVAQAQASVAQAATTLTNVTWGGGNNNNVFTAYFDDLLVTSSAADYPIGDGRIQSLLPDGVTAVNDPAGSTVKDDANANVAVANPGAATRLDETPMTSTSDFIKHIGANSASYAQLSFADTAPTGACVNAVSAIVAQHGSNATGGIGATYVYDGATQRTVSASAAISGTSVAYKSAIITPASGTWDATKLNGLVARVGYSSNATSTDYPAWDALRLEYETTP